MNKNITIEQETGLVNRIKQEDEQALCELCRCNLRFVASVAKQYQNRGKSLEELIETGNKGLELAARKFDPKRDFKFISYAAWFIRASIAASLGSTKNEAEPSDFTKEDKCKIISLCSNGREREILTKWFELGNSQESFEEIGQSLNLTSERVRQLRNKVIHKFMQLRN